MVWAKHAVNAVIETRSNYDEGNKMANKDKVIMNAMLSGKVRIIPCELSEDKSVSAVDVVMPSGEPFHVEKDSEAWELVKWMIKNI